MNRLFILLVLLAFAGCMRFDAAEGRSSNIAKTHLLGTLAVKPTGPIETVFSHKSQACSGDDIPDDGARAFRDASGKVHLIASHYVNSAMVGHDLDHLKKNCDIIYKNAGDPDPSHFNDLGWLESYYTPDGKHVHALVSHDYHPTRHGLPCGGESKPGAGDCWYSAITYASSNDGGASFTSPPPGPARFVAGSPYRFDPTHTQPVGAFVPTNIVRFKGAYYALVSFSQALEQKAGDCLMRTNDLSDPAAWRAWDGKDFTVRFASPYATPNLDPKQHTCQPVSPENLKWPVRSLLAMTGERGFLATLQGARMTDTRQMIFGVYVAHSKDLISWSEPMLVMDLPSPSREQCKSLPNSIRYAYPSILDPKSLSLNFDTVGDSAYIYMTRFNDCALSMDRDLVRFPVSISLPTERQPDK